MRLAVSNIAWAATERNEAYALLRDHGIEGLEIAPGLFFSGAADPFVPTLDEASTALDALERAGLRLVSMQSLLFGVTGAALFGNAVAHSALRRGMSRAIGLAGRFGIPNLVFGSPAQRVIPDGMDRTRARQIAAEAFREMGDEASQAGTSLGVEFNPAAYGTNFLNEGKDALAFVQEVDHPAVTLILDVGAMEMNGQRDQIADLALMAKGRISHVHISEPNLAPAPADTDAAAAVMTAMADSGYGRWFSIEMKAGAGLAALSGALERLTGAARLASRSIGLAAKVSP